MSRPVALHVLAGMDAGQRETLLQRAEADLGPYVEAVGPIIEEVRSDGDAALVRLAKRFDGAELSGSGLVVSEEEFGAARAQLDGGMLETLELAASNIRRFHDLQGPDSRSWDVELLPGVTVGERLLPVESAACYCPSGKGSFPSVALMTVIPAAMAGVPETVMLTPPRPDGTVDPGVLAAARIAGAKRVVKAGGAQAVAAAAYGTESVPRCVKIEGPGSPWVAAAKRALAGVIESRLPAGPSETVILADETADPRLCALDLLIESEHGPDSSAFLVTWSEEVAARAREELPGLMERMGETRRGYCEAVLSGSNGGVVLAGNEEEAFRFVNDYAPEHLQVMSKEPERHLDRIANAAEVLLGERTPGSIANYVMGPNCVLPTNGAAKVHSPLSVRDFLRSSTVGRLDGRGYAALAPHTKRFAEYEGFEGHANAVSEDR